MKNAPCYKCGYRTDKCHGGCEVYKAYRSELDRRNAIRREIHVKNDDLNDVEYALRSKLRKIYGRVK